MNYPIAQIRDPRTALVRFFRNLLVRADQLFGTWIPGSNHQTRHKMKVLSQKLFPKTPEDRKLTSLKTLLGLNFFSEVGSSNLQQFKL